MATEKSNSRNKLIIRLAVIVVVLVIALFAYMYFSERARLLNAGRYFTYGENKLKEAQGIPIDPSDAVSVTQQNKPIDVDVAYEAIANYRQSVGYDEQRADSWVGMANVHTKLKEFDKAIEVLEEASEVKFEQVSNKVIVFSALGDAYFSVGNYQQASEAYDQAIAVSPLNPLVALGYAKKVLSKLEIGDLSEVDKFAEWVRQGQSLDNRAEYQHIYHYALGWTYAVRGRADQALAEYREAMSFNNNYPPLLYKVATIER
ncbi:MAG: tetratricopeptide repeat protein, partial [Bacillota bacterium]